MRYWLFELCRKILCRLVVRAIKNGDLIFDEEGRAFGDTKAANSINAAFAKNGWQINPKYRFRSGVVDCRTGLDQRFAPKKF